MKELLELLQNYSIGELITIIIGLGLSIKGFIGFYDWADDRIRKVFNKQTKQEKEKQEILDKLEAQSAATQEVTNELKNIRQENSALKKKLDILFESDKDDIRAWITQQHHYFTEIGCIDDYSLDCLERRFKHYQQEGGNTYAEDLMNDLRKLPKKSFVVSQLVQNNEIKGE